MTWSQAAGLHVRVDGHDVEIPTTRFNGRWEPNSDGIRESWSEAALYVEGGMLLLVVTAVEDTDGGIDRKNWEIWQSTDGGATFRCYEKFFRATGEPIARLST
ncbi:MAG: hypothetical protein JST54_17690 [Deltaproteobacteria bacterium]|nr:hypothetical protein [Deltaproteobacteria bacterium]